MSRSRCFDVDGTIIDPGSSGPIRVRLRPCAVTVQRTGTRCRLIRAERSTDTEVPAQKQEQARRPPGLAATHTKPHSASGGVAAADHTRSGAEQRARTTAVAIVAAAQNGTYACVRGLEASSALACMRYAANH